MSLLADFDFITEISNSTLLNMIKATGQIGGVPLIPPFELTLSISQGSAHIIVTDVQIDLNGDDTVSLHLSFEDSSTVLEAPISRVVCPMKGEIKARVPVKIVRKKGTWNIYLVAVSMVDATVTISYTKPTDQVIDEDLKGSLLTRDNFKKSALRAVTEFVKTVPTLTIPMEFKVVPGANGSLSPLQFSNLQVHCISHAKRSKQALGLFGNLLAATQKNGDHTKKSATAIYPGSDMAVSISPGAFHTLVFCPAIAKALESDMNNLPGSCGSSSGLDVEGVTIKAITESFAEDCINVDGSFAKSGFCYDASGTFHGVIKLSISGSQLKPEIQLDEPDVDVDIPIYCYIAATVILGPIGPLILGIIDKASDGVATNLASSALDNALEKGISGVDVSGFSGSIFTGLKITKEGITLFSQVPIYIPSSTFWKRCWFNGSVTNGPKTVHSTGVYWHKFSCMEKAKAYPYTEYAQNQVAIYNLNSQLVATPISAAYSLRSKPGATAIQLIDKRGTAELTGVETTYQTPLATGGTKVTQSIHIDYEVSGTMVKLRNRPEEGNFSVELMGQFTDGAGGILSPQTQHVTFMGNNVEFGETYYEDYHTCMSALEEEYRRSMRNYKYKKDIDISIWLRNNYPDPKEIFSQILILSEVGEQVTEDMLLQSRLAHGASFVNAFHANSETKLGRVIKPEIQGIQIAAQEAQMKAQISQLTAQLEALNIARRLGNIPVFRKNKQML